MSLKVEACISELVGTFFLVLTIGYNTLQRTALAPLSIGSMLMAMIFATGKVSGGHFNPAVTLGVYLRGKVDAPALVAYIGSQLLGGMLAAIVYMELLGATFTFSPGAGYTLGAAAFVELMFSAALVFVVLSVATTKQDNDNWYYGLAIGFTVMAGAFAIGPISGCSLNPAVTLSVMTTHLIHTGNVPLSGLLVYTISPLLGAVMAVMLFKLVRKSEFGVSSASDDDVERVFNTLEPQKFPNTEIVLPQRKKSRSDN
jgi:aquaporin Z